MKRLLLLCVAALGCLACDGPYVPEVPDELSAFYQVMQKNALGFPRVGGAWQQHFGDAPFYGTAFYVRAGHDYDRADYRQIAEEARQHDLDVIEQAADNLAYYTRHLEEAMMAALGLIEYAAQTGDRDFLDVLERFIDRTDALATAFGDYLDPGAMLGTFALPTYGPTALSAAAALLNLQYATYLPTDRQKERLQRAMDIAAAIDGKAFDGRRYRVRPGDDLLELYPNMMMMLVLCRLYERTGDAAYRRRAETVFEGIQPLKNRARGGYNSPYSAKEMGARTDDYSTLSSQNYLTLAFLLLFEDTGDGRYFEEALGVLDFIRLRLYDPKQGRLLHHFIDGTIARPTDPEYFCAGCNLQFLYVVWYLKEHTARPGGPR